MDEFWQAMRSFHIPSGITLKIKYFTPVVNGVLKDVIYSANKYIQFITMKGTANKITRAADYV